MGRKKMPVDKSRTAHIHIRVTPSFKHGADSLAKRKGMTLTELVETLLKAAIGWEGIDGTGDEAKGA